MIPGPEATGSLFFGDGHEDWAIAVREALTMTKELGGPPLPEGWIVCVKKVGDYWWPLLFTPIERAASTHHSTVPTAGNRAGQKGYKLCKQR